MFGRLESAPENDATRAKEESLELDEHERLANRARFLEEASHGVYVLLQQEEKNRAWLASRLGKSRSFVSKILEGSHNFTLETLADVYLSFGKATHLSLSSDPGEMRLPTDEQDETWRSIHPTIIEFGHPAQWPRPNAVVSDHSVFVAGHLQIPLGQTAPRAFYVLEDGFQFSKGTVTGEIAYSPRSKRVANEANYEKE